MTPTVLVLGGLNMDLVVESPRFPAPGETVVGSGFETTAGGKGGNQAVAAARGLGDFGAVRVFGRLGNDAYGLEMMELLHEDGIDTTGVVVDRGLHTGVAVIAIATELAAQNTVTAVYGANNAVGGPELVALEDALAGASVLLLQQETPLDVSMRAARMAREAGVTVVLDPAPAREVPDGFFVCVDIITPNQGEAEVLSGIVVTDVDSAEQAAAVIREMGVGTVLVTLGEMGCFALSEGFSGQVPAFAVRPASTLAAGDAFNGGLAAALAEGLDLEAAVRRGQATAALCVQRPGAQAAMPYRHEVLGMVG